LYAVESKKFEKTQQQLSLEWAFLELVVVIVFVELEKGMIILSLVISVQFSVELSAKLSVAISVKQYL
jgi:hypothetical protein